MTDTADRVHAYVEHLRSRHPDATPAQAVEWLPEAIRDDEDAQQAVLALLSS